MAGVIPHAEIAYIKYAKDQGINALIIWFRAELAGRDEATKERLGALSDARLQKYENETEALAIRWRAARQARSEKTSVA